MSERALVMRWFAGHAKAAEAQRELLRHEGSRGAQAIAEWLSALNALDCRGDESDWAGARDPVAARQVDEVRAFWARLQKRGRRAR